MFLSGSYDTDTLVFDKLSQEDLVKVSCSFKLTTFQRENFWLRQLLIRWKYYSFNGLNPQLFFWRVVNCYKMSKNTEENKPLCIAAAKGDLEATYFFYKSDKFAYFAIKKAISNLNLEVLKYLLKNHISHTNISIERHLVRDACFSGDPEIVNAFLKQPTCRKYIFIYTIKLGKLEILYHLNSLGYLEENYITDKPRIFYYAAKSGKWPMLNHFLNKGYNYWVVGFRGAVYSGSLSFTKFFMEQFSEEVQKELAESFYEHIIDYRDSENYQEILDYLAVVYK